MADPAENSLVIFSRAAVMLAEANTIQKTHELKDLALTAADFAKRRHMGREAVQFALSYAFEAERKMGQLLATTPRAIGTRTAGGGGFSGGTVTIPPEQPATLAELGITKKESSQAQLLYRLPEETFDELKSGKKSLATVVQEERREKRLQARAEVILPPGQYNVVYADPPWKYDNSIQFWGASELHYESLSLDDICHLRDSGGTPVQDKFADPSVLFLWVTNPFLQDAFEVVDAWGFEYKTNMVWVKKDLQRPGSGFYVRGRHELLFICTRGSFVPNQEGKEPIGSVIEAPLGEHSQKPAVVYDIIQRMYPDQKYLELFARNRHEGWESWGNEL